ncbi:M18 family aminopeptidase [Candidatus Methylospira mobilis]|uniref:M18 family aminopeptidase n=1 Tax=Candidatus Methylospira mobilis TaxID=1808979 RepID=A0A5Q0BJ97_9GAMM|nr:M18 family aminopeptidase [Candidatus Methylospira mobilis]QFY43945.1 M18 family aminopeptidase [Candidatus Methylospira mobilis]
MTYPLKIEEEQQLNASRLLRFIDNSPSPWHAAASIAAQLEQAGYRRYSEQQGWRLKSGDKGYVLRADASLICFRIGNEPLRQTGFRVIGAHTDSPGLRVKPRPVIASGNMLRLGVEIYGGPILATFTDRDLSLAGRLIIRNDGGSLEMRLIRFAQPLVRLPNLPIHLNRNVNEDGLKLHKQNELPLLFGNIESSDDNSRALLALLAEQAAIDADAIVSTELSVCDTQCGSFWGSSNEFIANSQLDNLASCHAALTALTAQESSAATSVCGFFDHEEVGSVSYQGAGGNFLSVLLERIAQASGLSDEDHNRAIASSFFVSADMAHAWHPNFPAVYDEQHRIFVNKGPVIKHNANQSYATSAVSEACFIGWCEAAGVEYQRYVHCNDLRCGGTIGSTLAASLGMRTVDVGNPLWAMHSLRESAGVLDHSAMIRVMEQFFQCGRIASG